MVRSIIIAGIAVIAHSTIAQVAKCEAYGAERRLPPSYRQPGLIEASATFSPSIMLNRNSSNFYLSGFAEYHFDRKISLRSDNFFHLNGLEDNPFVHNAFRSYFGVLYHFNQDFFSNVDPYVSFQPGITIMSMRGWTPDGAQTFAPVEPSRNVVSPSFMTSLGVKYYVWDYFNFFANVSYVNSSMGGVVGGPFRTDEMIMSAGLGFQIPTSINMVKKGRD
jgi:hypothetical protein